MFEPIALGFLGGLFGGIIGSVMALFMLLRHPPAATRHTERPTWRR